MTASETIPVTVIFGATACGKTALTARIFASCKQSDSRIYSQCCSPYIGKAEIVSADSVQVYRGMPVGSAQPSQELMQELPHHLIAVCSPSQEFSVADFIQQADILCKEIIAREKIPIVVGGSAFFIKHFMYGLPITPAADPHIRKQLQKKMQREGAEAMYAALAAFDPVSAERIHPHDEYRIIRAHEIYIASGKPLSSFELSYRYREGYRFCPIFLNWPRGELYRRIEKRVDDMFSAGMVDEIQALCKAGYTAESPAMKAIGYREFFELSPVSPADAPKQAVIERIKKNSKRYAKRQQTFFQSFPHIHQIDMTQPEREQLIITLLDHFYSC